MVSYRMANLAVVLVSLLFATSFAHDFTQRMSSLQHLFSDDFSVEKCSVQDLQSLLKFVVSEGHIADVAQQELSAIEHHHDIEGENIFKGNENVLSSLSVREENGENGEYGTTGEGIENDEEEDGTAGNDEENEEEEDETTGRDGENEEGENGIAGNDEASVDKEEEKEIDEDDEENDDGDDDEAERVHDMETEEARAALEVAPHSELDDSDIVTNLVADEMGLEGVDDMPLEFNSSFERIAFALSGVYYRRRFTRSCPTRLELQLAATNKTLGLNLPGAFVDKSKRCYSTMNSSNYMSLINETSPDSLTFSIDAGSPSADSLHGNIPGNALQCPCGEGSPFVSTSITPLSRYMVPLLMQRLKAVGIDSEMLDYVFTPILEDEGQLLNKTRAGRSRQTIQEALSHLSHEYVLSLNRKPFTEAEARGTQLRPGCSTPTEFCVLQGGARGIRNSRKSTKAFMDTLLKLHSQHYLPIPKLEGETFYLSNGMCLWNQWHGRVKAAAKVKVLRLLKTSVSGYYGSTSWFKVEIDGTSCGLMEIYRYSELFWQKRRLLSTTSILVRKIRSFLQRSQRSSEDRRSANFFSFFPDFVDELQTMEQLANMFIGRINVNQCAGHMDTETVEFVLVKKPLSFFLCGKNALRSSVCDEYESMNTAKDNPYATVADDDANPAAYLEDANVQDVGFGSIVDFTFFVGGQQDCGYTSSRSVAEDFRKALHQEVKKRR